MSLAWDSPKVENTSTPRVRAVAATSSMSRLFPMPAGPVTLTTQPWPAIDPPRVRRNSQQLPYGHRSGCALDCRHLRLAEHRGVRHQSCRGLAQHHPTGRRDRFHPLCQSDLLTDRCVTERTRTDLTGDLLAGIQAHPQPQLNTVAACNPLGQTLA